MQFETLKLLAKTKPIPSNKTTQRINNLLAERNSPTSSRNHPSAFAFNRIVDNLVKMKEKDQAITYESFLKR